MNGLPLELLGRILGYLTPPGLLSLGLTSKRFLLAVREDKTSWKRLFSLDFHASLESPGPDTLAEYKKRSTEALVRRKTRLVHAQGRFIEAKLAKREKTFFFLLDFFFSLKSLVVSFGFSAITTCALLTCVLPNSSCRAVTECALVLIPMGVFLFVLGLGMVVDGVLYRKRLDTEGFGVGMWEKRRGLGKMWVEDVAGQCSTETKRWVVRRSGLGFYGLAVGFLACLVAKLDGRGLAWSVVFVPFWGMIGLCLVVTAPDDFYSASGIRRIAFSAHLEYFVVALVTIFPIFIFSVLLAVKLDRVNNMPLEFVFIPIWFLDTAMYALVALFSFSAGLADNRRELRSNMGFLVTIYVVLSPIVAFEAMLCVYVANPLALTAQALFSPLFLWFSLSTLVAVLYVCVDDDIDNDVEATRLGLGSRRPGITSSAPISRWEEIQRQSFASSINPHFAHHVAATDPTRDLNPSFWDTLFSQLNEDAYDPEFENDFQRMQAAIARALVDMNQPDAVAVAAAEMEDDVPPPSFPPPPVHPPPAPPVARQPLESIDEEDDDLPSPPSTSPPPVSFPPSHPPPGYDQMDIV